ncbi:MAG: hypothetical protein EP335_17475 [Alphaproteobacteria bacterium]|nr:MAG: hypothetical protein EP335_17475 [Alphaproteobacteria bacterium]
MTPGSFLLYDSVIASLGEGSLPPLDGAALTAMLLRPDHVPDLAAHCQLADVQAFEMEGGNYRRLALTGARLERVTGGVAFRSDPLIWGDPVDIGPAGYMVLAFGSPAKLVASATLLGIQQLADGAVEAVRSRFSIAPADAGWFHLGRA